MKRGDAGAVRERGGRLASVRPPAPPPHRQSASESCPRRLSASSIPQIRCWFTACRNTTRLEGAAANACAWCSVNIGYCASSAVTMQMC